MLNNKYIADVTSHPDNYRNDYYPYGMLACPVNTGLPNRHEAGNEYRYGYQGSEKDDEIKGEGNSYTTHFRQLDPRVGRWLSIDPKATAWESPYVSMGNNPVWYNDVLGDSSQTHKGGNIFNEKFEEGKKMIETKLSEKTGLVLYHDKNNMLQYKKDEKGMLIIKEGT